MTRHRDITPEEHQQLANSLHEVLQENPELKQEIFALLSDPRNEDDFDTWDVGMEPIPGDQTWKSKAIDVKVSKVND